MGHDSDYTESQLRFNRFARNGFQMALESLAQEVDSEPSILNLGVGPGGNLDLFSEVFDDPEVTAVDISQPHLDRAREEAKEELDVEFLQGDVNKELGIDKEYDLVWASDLLNPDSVEHPKDVVKEIKQYMNKSGKAALYFNNWLRPTFLPGYPELEAKILSEVSEEFENNWQGYKSNENAFKWLKEADFSNIEREFYQITLENPYDESMDYPKQVVKEGLYQNAVERLNKKGDLSEEELGIWNRLSDEESEAYIFQQEGYYASIPGVLFTGEK